MADHEPLVSIVTVNYDGRRHLEALLPSLLALDYPPGRREILVVDNGSTDGSQEMLRTRFPAVRLIQNDVNVGLGRASNQGIEATTAPYILLLNNDTIVNRDSLDALIDFMIATPDAGRWEASS